MSYFNITKILYKNTSLKFIVDDVLMVFFFFLVGMELKKELTTGHLSSKTNILLPFVCAVGGMILPMIIYLGFNYTIEENIKGFAVPAAKVMSAAIRSSMVAAALARRTVPSAV